MKKQKTKYGGHPKMKRIQSAYKDLFTILSSTNPFLVPLAFVLAVLSGVLPPVFVLASERLMTDGLSIARGELAFSAIVPTMLVFIVTRNIFQIILQNVCLMQRHMRAGQVHPHPPARLMQNLTFHTMESSGENSKK